MLGAAYPVGREAERVRDEGGEAVDVHAEITANKADTTISQLHHHRSRRAHLQQIACIHDGHVAVTGTEVAGDVVDAANDT